MTSSEVFSGFAGPAGTVRVGRAEERVVVHLGGEVDACLGPALGRGVEEALATGLPVLVQAREVTFMDSTGLGFLARLASRSAERRITVSGAPDVVRHLVHRARLEGMVELVDVPDEAGGAGGAGGARPAQGAR